MSSEASLRLDARAAKTHGPSSGSSAARRFRTSEAFVKALLVVARCAAVFSHAAYPRQIRRTRSARSASTREHVRTVCVGVGDGDGGDGRGRSRRPCILARNVDDPRVRATRVRVCVVLPSYMVYGIGLCRMIEIERGAVRRGSSYPRGELRLTGSNRGRDRTDTITSYMHPGRRVGSPPRHGGVGTQSVPPIRERGVKV